MKRAWKHREWNTGNGKEKLNCKYLKKLKTKIIFLTQESGDEKTSVLKKFYGNKSQVDDTQTISYFCLDREHIRS